MKRKIMNKINSTNWKFHELLKLKEVAQSVSSELYHELDLKDQLDMIWEVNIGKDLTFGSLFKQTVMSSLESEVMNAFQEKFESATVSFSGEEKSITPSQKKLTETMEQIHSTLKFSNRIIMMVNVVNIATIVVVGMVLLK